MKATGIVRRIDELGRVVIPKEIRRTQLIRVADPLEIFIGSEGEVIFKKYSAVGGLQSLAGQVTAALAKTLSCGVLLCDRDKVLCAQGVDGIVPGASLAEGFSTQMETRRLFCADTDAAMLVPVAEAPQCVSVLAPILVSGDLAGALALCAPAAKTEKEAATLTAVRFAVDVLARSLDA